MKTPALLLPLLTACASFLLPASLRAAPPSVTVGATAPPLATGAFLQGEPVKSLEPGKVYLLDFWATWCAPCQTTIPRLNGLQGKYADKGLVVIGQDIFEKDPGLPAAFIKKLGEEFTYRAAADDTSDGGEGKMFTTWLQASGIPSIPTAFLVNREGKIAWIGQPVSLREELLESVLAGTHDLAAAAKAYEEQRLKDEEVSSLTGRVRLQITARLFDEAEADIKALEPLTAQSQPFLPMMLRLEIATHRPNLPVAAALTKKFAADFAKSPGLVVHACSLLIDAAKDDRASLETAEQILSAISNAATSSEVISSSSGPGQSTTIKKTSTRDLNLIIQLAKVKNGLQKKDEALALGQEALAMTPEKSRGDVKKMLEGVLPADMP